jgi:phenylpyruvate tautomerase PptA (4-oxalocrotonate tautomerase family)
MPIVRVDVPEGHPREALLRIKRRIEDSIARTWAKDHIYVAVREMIAEPGDRSAIVTVDLRPGRGKEEERASALYRQVLETLQENVGTDGDRFVLLVRESPERGFVVDGGRRLPPLAQITPELATRGS